MKIRSISMVLLIMVASMSTWLSFGQHKPTEKQFKSIRKQLLPDINIGAPEKWKSRQDSTFRADSLTMIKRAVMRSLQNEAQSRLDSIVEYDDTNKQFVGRTIVTYPGEYLSHAHSIWEADEEVWRKSDSTLYRFDANGNMIYYENYYWATDQWMGATKVISTFDDENYETSNEYYYWSPETENWTGGSKTAVAYDAQRNVVLSEQYSWNHVTNSWKGESKTVSEYDETGLQTLYEYYHWPQNEWIIIYREVIQLRSDGSKAKHEKYSIDEDILVLSELTEFDYDEQGKLSLYINYLRDFETNNLQEDYKEVFNYNAQGNQISSEYFTKDGDEWVIEHKTVSEYDEANNRTLYEVYGWEGITGNWQERSKSVMRYNSMNRMIYQENYSGNGVTWVPTSKHVIDFDGNLNKTLEEYYTWDRSKNDWLPQTKYVRAFDNNNNETLYEAYRWNVAQGNWIGTGTKYISRYNTNNQQILSEYSIWDLAGKKWENQRQFIYEFNENRDFTLTMISKWDKSINEWVPESKSTSGYDEKWNITESESFIWDKASNKWVLANKKNYSYDRYNNLIFEDQLVWLTENELTSESHINYYYNNTELSENQITIEPTGGNKSVEITTNATWQTSTDAEWLTIQPVSGKGDGTIVFTAPKNDTRDTRIAIVTIASSGLTVTVTQDAAGYIDLSTVAETVVAVGAVVNVTVTSNTVWQTATDADWLTLNPTTGANDGEITITAARNNQKVPRSAIVKVSIEGEEKIITITQDASLESNDATLKGIIVNDDILEINGSEIYYLLPEGYSLPTAKVALILPEGATVNVSNPFDAVLNAKPGKQTVPFTITSEDGSNSDTYTLTIERYFEFNTIVKQRWNNTLSVINNPANNSGYKFKAFQWFKNGVAISTAQYYSAGSKGEQLNPNDEYYVQVTTEEGEVMRTYPARTQLKSLDIKVYPNPAIISEIVTVEADLDPDLLDKVTIEVYNTVGARFGTTKIQGKHTPVVLPPNTGTYILKLTGEDFDRNLKVIVK